MTELVRFLVAGVVKHPEDVVIDTQEGEAAVVIELQVNPADLSRVNGPDGETLRAIRQVVSASAGQRKAILELVSPGTDVRDVLADDPATDER